MGIPFRYLDYYTHKCPCQVRSPAKACPVGTRKIPLRFTVGAGPGLPRPHVPALWAFSHQRPYPGCTSRGMKICVFVVTALAVLEETAKAVTTRIMLFSCQGPYLVRPKKGVDTREQKGNGLCDFPVGAKQPEANVPSSSNTISGCFAPTLASPFPCRHKAPIFMSDAHARTGHPRTE